jgi:hypothetical protein
MTETLYIEWVEFQLRAGVTDAQLYAASDAFQTAFLDLQPGYQHRALVRLGTPGHFADCVHWTGVNDMEAAMAAGKAIPEFQAYFALLQVTKAPTVGKTVAQYGSAKIPLATDLCASTWGGMEFSLFKPIPGVSDQALQRAAQHMANGLYRGQPGFLHHAVVKSEQGIYADVVLAASGKRAAELCASWGSGPLAEPCRGYLDMISPESVQLAFFDVLQ